MRKSEKSEDQKMEQWFGPDSKSPPTTGTQGGLEGTQDGFYCYRHRRKTREEENLDGCKKKKFFLVSALKGHKSNCSRGSQTIEMKRINFSMADFRAYAERITRRKEIYQGANLGYANSAKGVSGQPAGRSGQDAITHSLEGKRKFFVKTRRRGKEKNRCSDNRT